MSFIFFFQAEDGIRDDLVTGVQTCALPICLGDVSAKNYPKMTLIAPPQHGGALTTRSFIPHVCHDAIGVLAAVTVGTAVKMPGTVCDGVAQLPQGAGPLTVSVEHPTRQFSH